MSVLLIAGRLGRLTGSLLFFETLLDSTIQMARTYGLTRWQLYTQVILPGALSSILVRLRFSRG